MKVPEQGDGWELVRAYTTADTARVVGKQVSASLGVGTLAVKCVHFPWRPLSTTRGVFRYTLVGLRDHAIEEGYSELADVIDDLTDDYPGDRLLVNRYTAFGRIGRHYDYADADYRLAPDGVALALRGTGYIRLHGDEVSLRVDPGDLFKTYNRGRTVTRRAEHSFRAGADGRLSLGF